MLLFATLMQASAAEIFATPSRLPWIGEWSDLFLDSWMILCIVGFIGFAVISDQRKRKRREQMLVTHKEPSVIINHIRNGEWRETRKYEDSVIGKPTPAQTQQVSAKSTFSSSSSIFRRMMATSVSSSSLQSRPSGSFTRDLTGERSPVDLENEEELEEKAQDVNDDASSNMNDPFIPPRATVDASSVHRTPRTVYFKPISNQQEDLQSERIASVASVNLPPRSPLAPAITISNNQPPSIARTSSGSRFLPFGIRRGISRETSNSNISLSSVSSIFRVNSVSSFAPASTPSPPPRSPISPVQSPRLSSMQSSDTPSTQQRDELWNVALDRDECAVCFKRLYKEPVSVSADSEGRPTCLHVYHDRCLRGLKRRQCLLCGARFRFRRRIPDVELDPKGWFDTVDVDGSGGLSPPEIARVLAAQLPIDRPALEKLLKKNWRRWDADRSGEVDRDEFFAPRRGLLAYLKKKRPMFTLVEPETDFPDIRDDPKKWFQYFDKNKSRSLEKTEVLRGLIVSFSLSEREKICLNLRMVLDAVWPAFDPDLSNHITEDEFLEPKTGLATSLILSLDVVDKKRLLHSS